jgi:hypothetical protein
LSLINGSVFDERRLNRHWSNSRLTPSVRSTVLAIGSYSASTCAIVALASGTRRLISPLAGNSRIRSPTSSESGLALRHISCVTSSQGIMPLSQYEKSRK